MSELHRAFIEVMRGCNNHCVYCRNDDANVFGLDSNILNDEEIYGIIDELSEMNVRELVLTGGEPLLRESLLGIVNYATSLGMNTLIATNGKLLKNDFLSNIDEKMVRIQVSLDSVDKSVNDILRGEGSYKEAVNAINMCRNYGVPLQISTTITEKNYGGLKELIGYADSMGIPVKIRQLVNKGMGRDHPELFVGDDLLEDLLLRYVVNTGNRGEVSAEQVPFVCNVEGDDVYKICTAGNSILYIRHDGKVGPCPSADCVVGDVRQESIRDIYDSDLRQFRGDGYRAEGLCGRPGVLLIRDGDFHGKLSESSFSAPVGYQGFVDFGCKCTG